MKKLSIITLAVVALFAMTLTASAGESYRSTLASGINVPMNSATTTNVDFLVSGSTEFAVSYTFQMTTNIPAAATAGGVATLNWLRSADGSVFETLTNISCSTTANGTNYITGFTNWNVGATYMLRLTTIGNTSTNACVTNMTVRVVKKQAN